MLESMQALGCFHNEDFISYSERWRNVIEYLKWISFLKMQSSEGWTRLNFFSPGKQKPKLSIPQKSQNTRLYLSGKPLLAFSPPKINYLAQIAPSPRLTCIRLCPSPHNPQAILAPMPPPTDTYPSNTNKALSTQSGGGGWRGWMDAKFSIVWECLRQVEELAQRSKEQESCPCPSSAAALRWSLNFP